MTVTAADIQRSRRMDRDRAQIERRGAVPMQRIGARTVQAVLRAFRRDGEIAIFDAMRNEFNEVESLLADAMIESHLVGAIREVNESPASMSLSIGQTKEFRNFIDRALDRLGMTDEDMSDLDRRYRIKARQVVQVAEDELEQSLQKAIQRTAAEGMTTRQATIALTNTFIKAGITPDNSFMVENLFRTHTQLAYSAGQWQVDQNPVLQDILWGYKYVTVADDRVRPEHVGFHGVTLPKDHPFWDENFPPNGWSCRCVAISLYDTEEEVEPDTVDVDGRMVRPEADGEFRFNPGKRFPDAARRVEVVRQ